MNPNNFTERTRRVLALAREESTRLYHEYVGTEHILLGLIREGEGAAIAVLRNLRIDPDEVARRVQQLVRPGRPSSTTGPDLPYTSRAKLVLEESAVEQRALEHRYLGTEHILLGLLREGKGIAAQVLTEAGLTLEHARTETLRLLGTEMPPVDPAPAGQELPPADSATRSAHRVELILHYPDGKRVQGSFRSPSEAADFLNRLDPLQGG